MLNRYIAALLLWISTTTDARNECAPKKNNKLDLNQSSMVTSRDQEEEKENTSDLGINDNILIDATPVNVVNDRDNNTGTIRMINFDFMDDNEDKIKNNADLDRHGLLRPENLNHIFPNNTAADNNYRLVDFNISETSIDITNNQVIDNITNTLDTQNRLINEVARISKDNIAKIEKAAAKIDEIIAANDNIGNSWWDSLFSITGAVIISIALITGISFALYKRNQNLIIQSIANIRSQIADLTRSNENLSSLDNVFDENNTRIEALNQRVRALMGVIVTGVSGGMYAFLRTWRKK